MKEQITKIRVGELTRPMQNLKLTRSVETNFHSVEMSTMSSFNESLSFENDATTSNPIDDKNYKYVWYENDETGFEPVLYLGQSEEEGSLIDWIELSNGQQLKTKLLNITYVNPKCLRGVDDLLTMCQFDIGPLLHTVRTRYFRNEIYTAVGMPILISVNPYTKLSRLYSQETQELYQDRLMIGCGVEVKSPVISSAENTLRTSSSVESADTGLKPHIYRIAQNALKQLYECEFSQSIIISGESGAGKTEATKQILNYLSNTSKKYTASWTGKKQRMYSDMSTQLALSNHLLECFGNAKTIRNDNSSRFGKFTQIYFENSSPSLIGATITNYLLEKSRIVRQQENERNYHVFYQLCSSFDLLDLDLQESLRLCDPLYFKFTSKCTSIDGICDVEQFKDLLSCFEQIKFLKKSKTLIFKILAGILHIGNVGISESHSDNESIDDPESYETACNLFGLEQDKLLKVLQYRFILDAQNQKKIEVPRSANEIEAARDAIVKAIYEKLFDWLISNLNSELASIFGITSNGETTSPNSSRVVRNTQNNQIADKITRRIPAWTTKLDYNLSKSTSSVSNLKRNQSGASGLFSKHFSVGLLDIFGFEVFDINSFEQLCINFANEQLQRQFNLHVFQQEQHLYGLEEIDWKVIPYFDNKHIITALTDRIVGIFPMLDSESLVPKSTDNTFLDKIYAIAKETNNDVILKPESIIKRSNQFGVRHYAGPVYYSVIGFLEKNCDRVFPDALDYLKTSENTLLKQLFSKPAEQDNKQSTAFGRPGFTKSSVSATFRDQLEDLIKTLENTTTSYIRCMKPNSNKASLQFDSIDVLRQLKCAGVLESIRIRKSGYPIRISIVAFYKRYKILFNTKPDEEQYNHIPVHKLREIVLNFITDATKSYLEESGSTCHDFKQYWQLGKTKIFMKTNIQQHIDSKLIKLWHRAATKIKSCIKGYIQRKLYKKLIHNAKFLQEIYQYKTMATSFLLHFRRLNEASAIIQNWWKIQMIKRRKDAVNVISTAWILFKHRKNRVKLRKCSIVKEQIITTAKAPSNMKQKKSFEQISLDVDAIVNKTAKKSFECKTVRNSLKVIKENESAKDDFNSYRESTIKETLLKKAVNKDLLLRKEVSNKSTFKESSSKEYKFKESNVRESKYKETDVKESKYKEFNYEDLRRENITSRQKNPSGNERFKDENEKFRMYKDKLSENSSDGRSKNLHYNNVSGTSNRVLDYNQKDSYCYKERQSSYSSTDEDKPEIEYTNRKMMYNSEANYKDMKSEQRYSSKHKPWMPKVPKLMMPPNGSYSYRMHNNYDHRRFHCDEMCCSQMNVIKRSNSLVIV